VTETVRTVSLCVCSSCDGNKITVGYTRIISLYTIAFCGDPLIVNPLGFAIATDTVSPLPTVMAEIAILLVVPVADNAPLVVPITVMSLAANVVGSTLNVRIKPVESAVPSVPPVCYTLSKVTAIGVVSPPLPLNLQPIVINNDAAISKPKKMVFFSFIDFPPKFIFIMPILSTVKVLFLSPHGRGLFYSTTFLVPLFHFIFFDEISECELISVIFLFNFLHNRSACNNYCCLHKFFSVQYF